MEIEKITILYVDDEQNNLISFKSNFRKLYDVHTAGTVEEAMNILRKNEIHVILTDQKMPGTTGVQFLESIIKEHPFPVRMIITGYADMDSVIQSINKGEVYRYILKPFDINELKLIIDSAYDLYLFRKTSDEKVTRYKHLFDSSSACVFIIDQHGSFMEMNTYGLNLFKIKQEDIRHYELLSFFIDPEQYKKLYGNLIISEAVIDLPLKLKTLNKEIIEVLFSASKMSMKGNQFVFQGMMRDITRQKEIENLMIRTIIETQEVERSRFSKNLHDGVGSMLAAIKLQLYVLTNEDHTLKNNPQLPAIVEGLNSTIVEIRNICFNITPITLELMGLPSAIEDLTSQYESSSLIKFDYSVPDHFPKLHTQLELAIFRVIQEFINNSMTHGKANKIKIGLAGESNKIKLVLKDNGLGFDINSYRAGLGIKNIKSRVRSFNGELIIRSELMVGTEFELTWPVIVPEQMST
ncbi:MAG: atoC [Bacteroidetes bacterium]|nr:atoC [Bacteroidota bacterium]